MINDIAIMVFALIAIFTGKKWAIITATIWFIIVAVLGISFGVLEPSLTNPNLETSFSNTSVPTIEEALDDTDLTNEEIAGVILIFFEIFFILLGWLRVIFTKKRQVPQA